MKLASASVLLGKGWVTKTSMSAHMHQYTIFQKNFDIISIKIGYQSIKCFRLALPEDGGQDLFIFYWNSQR